MKLKNSTEEKLKGVFDFVIYAIRISVMLVLVGSFFVIGNVAFPNISTNGAPFRHLELASWLKTFIKSYVVVYSIFAWFLVYQIGWARKVHLLEKTEKIIMIFAVINLIILAVFVYPKM